MNFSLGAVARDQEYCISENTTAQNVDQPRSSSPFEIYLAELFIGVACSWQKVTGERRLEESGKEKKTLDLIKKLERATRIELATFSLGS